MAAEVVAFETRLAEHSWTPEQLRDLTRTLNRTPVDSLDALMPRFGLTDDICERSVSPAPPSSSTCRTSSAPSTGSLRETPPATLRAYLRWHVVRRFAGALACGVRRRGVRLLRSNAPRPARAPRAMEARAGRCGRGHRRGRRAAVRLSRLLAGGQGAMSADGGLPQGRDAPLHRGSDLDDRGDARPRDRQARCDDVPDRLPGTLAGRCWPGHRPRQLGGQSRARGRPPGRRLSSAASMGRSTTTTGSCPPTPSMPGTTRTSTR